MSHPNEDVLRQDPRSSAQLFIIQYKRIADIDRYISFSSHGSYQFFRLLFYQLVRFKAPLFIHCPESAHQLYFGWNNVGSITALEAAYRKHRRRERIIITANDLLKTYNYMRSNQYSIHR